MPTADAPTHPAIRNHKICTWPPPHSSIPPPGSSNATTEDNPSRQTTSESLLRWEEVEYLDFVHEEEYLE